MSEWNEPNPMQIGGFTPKERSFNLAKYGRHYTIVNSDGSIGKTFKQMQKEKKDRMKISKSKILSNPHEPKKCRICNGYIHLKRNGEGYTCENRNCTDKRNQKKMAKKDLKRREKGKSPIMPRISLEQLEQIIKA